MPDITAARPTSGAPVESSWGGQVHDALEGVQAGGGTGSLPSSANAQIATVTFARPYTAPPVVVCCRTSSTGTSPKVQVYPFSVTATGFAVGASTGDATTSSATLTFAWMAIGTPA